MLNNAKGMQVKAKAIGNEIDRQNKKLNIVNKKLDVCDKETV